ncbi:MAG: polysaccharide biosynthesis protein, partial [Clostridium sp.]
SRFFQRRDGNHILIAGAGIAGITILKEMQSSRHVDKQVCCLVDDDKNKFGKKLSGVKVEGTCADIPQLVEKHEIKEIYIAMPTATMQQRKRIAELASDTGCKVKILPGIYQLLNGEVSVSKLRDVQLEDLLGRETIETKLDEVMGYIQDKVVMITGGGGSIGSELCRQIARYEPKHLIVFDIYENNAYDIQQELHKAHPELHLSVLIGSVRNVRRLDDIFQTYHPQIIFHAAAHKHVPLMEDSPCEAVKNNVFGTYKTVMMADRYSVERFVLISTDKAVNPTNIMGATKRICEMIMQTMNRVSKTEFVAVRFGNVLGSNGSVVPLFKKQIAVGGPVTVTDKDIVRY